MRGQIFTFSGLTWFTMGGASSHDIQDGVLDPEAPDFEQKYWLLRRMRGMFRVKGRSWWAEEMPNAREYVEALKNLEQVNWKVDCIPVSYTHLDVYKRQGMRKESATVQKCKRQMATLGFDSQLAYHRVKLILKIYRDVVWVLSERMEELHEYAWELGARCV